MPVEAWCWPTERVEDDDLGERQLAKPVEDPVTQKCQRATFGLKHRRHPSTDGLHSLTDANAQRLAEQCFNASVDDARLRKKYFKKVLAVLPAKKAARYMQLEHKVQAVQRYEIAPVMPLAE